MIEYARYVEKLAKLHQVTDEGMSAFCARLRILRSMGVPDKPSPGSGKRVLFSKDDLFETHLALSLTTLGLTPVRIVFVVKSVRTTNYLKIVRQTDKTQWLFMQPDFSVEHDKEIIELNLALGDLTELVNKACPGNRFSSLLNFTRLVKDIDE